jgi:hypothetical protein
MLSLITIRKREHKPKKATLATVCPLIEKNLQQTTLPFHFTDMIRCEFEKQKKEVKRGERRHIQVEFNELYNWKGEASHASYHMTRNAVLDIEQIHPILAQDISNGITSALMDFATKEYVHQKRLVKLGLRKRIQVDLNVLYC